MYVWGKCCGRLQYCLIQWFCTIRWILSYLSALWEMISRAHRNPEELGWVDKEYNCQRPQFWVIFELPLEAGWREEKKKFQEEKHLLLLLANIWNSTTSLMQPYREEVGRWSIGPSICLYFPRQEAVLGQPLLYIWEVIRPRGGGWSEYRSVVSGKQSLHQLWSCVWYSLAAG